MKTVTELAREAGWDEHYAEFDIRIRRFHDAAIAQYRESLLAGVGEPHAWSTFDGEGSYDLRLFENNENYLEQYSPKYVNWVDALYTADQLAAAVAIERERLASMDWTTTLREGALVTWGDAETLGDRVAAAIRGQT